MEEVMVRRLRNFIERFKIINNNQYGFQKDKSINKLLGNFANHINTCLSENQHCLALFVDFSKAFDTLDHSKLLNTLERIGIRGNCLNFFKGYLQCRKFRVKIGTNLSNEIDVTHGVPQGSKLGPLLYLIYANDLINILKNSNTFAYADDTAIIVANRNLEVATDIMQNELNIATKWCHDNGLIINANKTKIMHIKPTHFRYSRINLKFHDIECIHNGNITNADNCKTTIELVNTYKYLGVYVDHNFKWRTHIEEVQKQLRKSSIMLYHLSNSATYSVLRQAYFSMSESYIRHGITAWGSSTYCNVLQNSQNRVLKILWKNLHKSINYNHANNTINTNNISTNHIINNTSTNNNTTNTINNTNNNFSTRNITNNNTSNNNNIINTNNTSNNDTNDNTNNNINISNTNTSVNNNNNSSTYRIRKNAHSSINIAKELKVLNIESLYKITLINNFHQESNYLHKINHQYNTRLRAEGRYKPDKFKNNYGKSKLDVQLPKILNNLPIEILNIKYKNRKKKEIKNFYLSSQ